MKLPKKGEVRKPSKTLAGVTPIAVQVYPKKCKHGVCLYCPSLGVPQSYTPLSPATIRAKMLNYDPEKQVKARLKAFKLMNHPTDKIELIIMGGTFLEYPLNYQYSFIKSCYDALNGKKSRDLEEAKKLNEKAKHRCVALAIETRPDVCSEKEISRLLEFGCTRVELGVQCLDDDIYRKVNRGHSVREVIESTRLLKNAGFKVGYHIMPGLPGSSPKKDLLMFEKIFSSPDFRPDQLKIYPCQVIKGSQLGKLYEQGKYKPYTKQQIFNLLIKMFKKIPEYCRVMRVMREIPPSYLIAGTERIDLRYDVESKLRKEKAKVNEIRFREIGFKLRDKGKKEEIDRNLKLKIVKYKASGGDEYFLQFINRQNILFGLLRLRIIDEINEKIAFIRELHIYGQAEKIGFKSEQGIQHKGLGKRLMKEAEKIAKERKVNEVRVISGVGVREYYRKLGYKLDKEGIYMIKKFT